MTIPFIEFMNDMMRNPSRNVQEYETEQKNIDPSGDESTSNNIPHDRE